jgi:hypothetical protein
MELLLDQQKKELLEKLARPLIKFLNENCRPHVEVTITPESFKLSETRIFIPVEDYIPD